MKYAKGVKKAKKKPGSMDDMAESPDDIVSAEASQGESIRGILKLLRKEGAPTIVKGKKKLRKKASL